MSLHEYEPGSPFPGVVGKTIDESSPAWPAPNRAVEGAPAGDLFVAAPEDTLVYTM